MNTNPIERLSAGLFNRVMLIDQVLKKDGHRLFYYSPKHIRSSLEPVPGYLIEERRFVSTRAEIPKVNGNWTYGTRQLLEQGMGYQAFADWSQENQVEVYVPLEFSELVANKLETFRLISLFRNDLHPYTEPYRQSVNQLQHFMERNDLVFLKPRAGNKGDQIISLRQQGKDFLIKYFSGGAQQKFKAATISEAQAFVKDITDGTNRYVIQEGIESLRLGQRVFDLRVIMLFDGARWDWIHEGRLSAENSDLSNVSQGGLSVPAEDLLIESVGPDSASLVMHNLRDISFELAEHLNTLHPGAIMEVAFDFVVGSDMKLQLVEINTKPGLASIGFSQSIVELDPNQEALFEQWVYPHTNSLAQFLASKL